jgi:hypothetical protein
VPSPFGTFLSLTVNSEKGFICFFELSLTVKQARRLEAFEKVWKSLQQATCLNERKRHV